MTTVLEVAKKSKMLRQRKREDDSCGYLPDYYSEEKDGTCSSGIYKMSTLFAIAVVVSAWAVLYSTAFYLNHRLPSLQFVNDSNSNDRFVGARAKQFLIKLADVGIKVPGSYELEIQAVDLFDREISSIIANANGFNKISYDHQKSTGAYYLAQPIGFVSAYSDVQNLVVKIGPHSDVDENKLPNLLINCHYDSAPSSPGASDDGLNCAVMIEVLRVLSLQNYTLQSNIVFLFNGAEETPLQASHGFITQHEWAKNVKAFINLESCGAGGKESLFQTGPQHPWLVQLYQEAAEHPFGLVLAEDLFQGGLVPSDTDFRIFRDFGHVPGLDFAHCDNGFVYHTRFDNYNKISDGVFQHTGDNLLSLARRFSSSKILHDPAPYKEGRMVYFDLGGLYMVTYSETTGVILNLATVLLSVYIVLQNVFTYTAGMQRKEVAKQLAMCVLVPGLGLTLSVAFVIIIAFVLDAFHSVLSWYSKPYLILPLYFAPTLIGFSLPPLLLNRIKFSNLCDGVRVQLYCNGVQLLWTIALFLAILTGLRSAYILLIAVLVTAVTNCILTLLNLQHDVTKWLIGYCFSTIIPAMYFVYLYILAMRLFIPITGRSGPNVNPELLVGVLSSLLCSLIFAYITPLIILVFKPWRLVIGLFVINIITILSITATPFGFPFAEDTPQRLVVLHTSRSFYNETGGLIKNDSGMWMMHVDRRAPGTYNAIPWFKDVTNIDSDCKKYLYCGLPLYYTRIANLERNPGSWVPMTPPSIPVEVSVQLNSADFVSTNVKRFNFTISGPHQNLIFLSPKLGVKLLGWDLEDNNPPVKGIEWGPRSTYVIRYTAGGYPGNPKLTFCIDLELQPGFPRLASHLDLAVAGHYIEKMKDQEKQLMKDYPVPFLSWAHVTTWTAAYRSYVF